MCQEGWRPDAASADTEEGLLKHVEMSWRKIAVIVLFVLQYLVIALYPLLGGDSNQTFDFMLAVMIVTMIIVGVIGGMSADKLAQSFAKVLVPWHLWPLLLVLQRLFLWCWQMEM